MTDSIPAGDTIAWRRALLVVAACAAVGAALLSVPATLGYDPWAWLVWGREVGHLDLDTTAGPSWKPLPVAVATIAAPFGSAAPAVWLVIARTGTLLALVGAFRLAQRLAGRLAGGIAVALLLLTPDAGPRYTRLLLEGHSAPWTAGLALWAVERHLAGRRWATLILLGLLALDRPEAWPFLGVYGLWLAMREPDRRNWARVGAVGACVPLLWFGGDWWGSGSPLHGADAAQVLTEQSGRLGSALRRAWACVVFPAWVAALVGAADGLRRRSHAVLGLAGLALGWVGLVVVMSVGLGYAAVARFYLPAAALLCVAAAVSVTRLTGRLGAGRTRLACLAAIAVVSAPSAVGRLSNLDTLLDEVRGQARSERDLADALDRLPDLDALVHRCGPLSVDTGSVERIALAWHAEVPIRDVTRAKGTLRGVVVVRSGERTERRLTRQPDATRLAGDGRWAIWVVDCPAADPQRS